MLSAGAGSYGVLRQAAGEVRTPAGDLSQLCPEGTQILHRCHARLAQGEAVSEKHPEE